MRRETDHVETWRALFKEEQSQLTEVAETLLYRCGSPEQIVQTALAQLEHQPFYGPLGKISSIRAVVIAAIGHNYSVDNPETVLASPGSVRDWGAGALPLESLSWAERAVYFLQEVLHYSRRDMALLLEISDANVDQLGRSAKKRMGIPPDAAVYSNALHPSTTRAVGSVHSMAFAPYE